MERKIELFLEKWKTDILRKPLIIYGSKQIGKTFTVLNFGKKEYKNVIYINTENNLELLKMIKRENSTSKIIDFLKNIYNEPIIENDTLIVFDNLTSKDIASKLKLFGSEKSKYHIIGITSKREKLSLFKSEELQFKGMNEIDFEEYLNIRGEKKLAEIIRKSYDNKKTNPHHKLTLELFHEYLKTGGLPEVIYAKLDGKTDNELNAIKQKIIDIYKKEISENKTLIDISRGIEVLNSIPYQLQKENKKFQYGLLGKGKRKKEYENAIKYLYNNQLVYRSYKIKKVSSPLTSNKDTDSFKLFMPDNGLLYTMLNLNDKRLKKDESLKEALYENHCAKTLAEQDISLYYYQSEGKAEVNFVIQNRQGQIIPIELITKSNSKAKSLSVFMKKHITLEGYRITENNFQTKKNIRYIPIYAIYCITDSK